MRWSNPPSSTPKESVLRRAHDTAYTRFCIDIYFHFLGLFTGMELLNPLDLAFWRMARLFSQWVGHFTTSNEILECLHLCQHTLLSFCYGHPSESDMASHCCTCFCAAWGLCDDPGPCTYWASAPSPNYSLALVALICTSLVANDNRYLSMWIVIICIIFFWQTAPFPLINPVISLFITELCSWKHMS